MFGSSGRRAAAGGVWALLAGALLGLAGLQHVLVDAAVEPGSSEPRCHHENCRYIVDKSRDLYIFGYTNYYEVEGNTVEIMVKETDTMDFFREFMNPLVHELQINCYWASVLDSPALPRVEPATHVHEVTLTNCPLPVNGSLANTFATLNFVFCKTNAPDESNCKLSMHNLSAALPLTAKHFVGLERLYSLFLSAEKLANSERGFLAPLWNLRELRMRNVTLRAGEVLPPLLNALELHDTGVERVPKVLYTSVHLRLLTIYSKRALLLEAVPPALHKLELETSATTLTLKAAHALENLMLSNWTELLPKPLRVCGELVSVHLTAPAMRALPHGWLANCTRLDSLVIENARTLTTLPMKLFTNKNALFHLALRQGVLEKLPAELLEDVSYLQYLELDGNRLQTIPRIVPKRIMKNLRLNLSSNDLDGNALNALSSLSFIGELDVSHNTRIGDVCDSDGYSAIHNLTQIQKLLLRGTGVSRICKDWREDMTSLELLDLSDTKVTELAFADLQFTRAVKAVVLLLGAPVTMVRMTQEDFFNAERTSSNLTYVHINSTLECDCRMYWTRRTLDHSPNMLDRVSSLSCTGGGLLRDVRPEDMVCARPEECAAAALPDECTCAAWAHDDPAHDPRLVRVRCENASLKHVPRLPANCTDRLYELLLANNRISDLHADDLQHNIKGLDLRNNSLVQVDEETAKRLGQVNGSLRLAGNPLECDCNAAPLLRALHERALAELELDKATTCRNGSALYLASYADCSNSATLLVTWLAAALAVLLTLVVVFLLLLTDRERRFFVLAVLHRWGCVWRAVEPAEEEGRCYDAFVTFSHKDEAVVRELIARLEPPYRLCVHHRDWIPGCFISDQVVQSVRESRRTVALVSRHFLASSWARAEFREAHAAAMLDARPRLVVVLLEEPAALQMDEQLRRYVTTHTYVRWEDPWFWDKLELVLPPPRPARPQSSGISLHLTPPPYSEPAVELLPVCNHMISADHPQP